eukprot:1714312-Prymnesium_polylepis.2
MGAASGWGWATKRLRREVLVRGCRLCALSAMARVRLPGGRARVVRRSRGHDGGRRRCATLGVCCLRTRPCDAKAKRKRERTERCFAAARQCGVPETTAVTRACWRAARLWRERVHATARVCVTACA